MTNLFCEDGVSRSHQRSYPDVGRKTSDPAVLDVLAPALESALNVLGTKVVPLRLLTVASSTKSWRHLTVMTPKRESFGPRPFEEITGYPAQANGIRSLPC